MPTPVSCSPMRVYFKPTRTAPDNEEASISIFFFLKDLTCALGDSADDLCDEQTAQRNRGSVFLTRLWFLQPISYTAGANPSNEETRACVAGSPCGP